MNADPSQPPMETSERHEYSPAVETSDPVDAPPPSYPAAASVQTTQEETAEEDDPLYNFLKNILPQAPTAMAAVEPQSSSVPSSDPVANPSYPAAEPVQITSEKSDAGDFFLNIGPPPKPRALGFPWITNTRDNVINQNNWDIV